MQIIIEKVIVEYIVHIEGLPHLNIKGRITEKLDCEDLNKRYYWSVSHYYRPSKNAGTIYIPSIISAPTIEEAEHALFAYLHNFTTIDVTPNEHF